jgi:hypothetical protein
MKKIKLGFADTHEHLARFFHSLLANRYDIEIDNNNPDYLIFGDRNFGETNRRFSKDDCIKIFYTGENQRPEDYDCHYAISFDHNFNTWHYRLPLFVIYMWSLDQIHNTGYNYYYILGEREIKEKTDFCSFVVGNPNCEQRNEFFKKLSANKRVDSPGKVFNNMDIKLDGEKAKIDFLSTRRFNICFEPYSYPGYTTEKILHAFYAGTVPIYWGNPLVTSDFNSKAFINAHDFEDLEELTEHVMIAESNPCVYNQYLEHPPLLNGLPKDYMILNNFLNWFDAVVYNKIEARP